MRIILYLILLILGCSSCNDDRQSSQLSRATIELVDVDSTYSLNDKLSIHIRKGTFSSKKGIQLEYLIADTDSTILENNLSTLTVRNQHLKSVGMIEINFVNNRGKFIDPQKQYEILYNDSMGITTNVDLFYGVEKDDLIYWKEDNLKDKYILDFTSNVRIGGKEVSLRLENTLENLTDYLDQKFGDSSKKAKLSLSFSKVSNKYYELDTVLWHSLVDLSLENDIREELSGIKLIDMDLKGIPDDYFKEGVDYKYSISIEPINLFSEKTENSIIYRTRRTGWFNFDIYMSSPIAKVKIDGLVSGEKIRLLSMNSDRCILPENFFKNVAYFSFPIESYTQKFRIYTKSGNEFFDRGIVELKQEDEISFHLVQE